MKENDKWKIIVASNDISTWKCPGCLETVTVFDHRAVLRRHAMCEPIEGTRITGLQDGLDPNREEARAVMAYMFRLIGGLTYARMQSQIRNEFGDERVDKALEWIQLNLGEG